MVSKNVIGTALLIATGLAAGGCADYQPAPTEDPQVVLMRTYNSIDGIAHYSVPQVEIQAKKVSFSLDPFKHLGNELKAQHITLPVSQEYFDEVEIGEELDSQFNIGGFLFEGALESYSVTISDKGQGDMFCLIVNNTCEETDSETYEALKALNETEGDFAASEDNPSLLLRESADSIDELFEDSCDIVIESQKTNFTLDIFKHITNSWNKMQYPVELPRFLCDGLEEGDELDKNFVGASLLFSSSPSQVTYRILKLSRDYSE